MRTIAIVSLISIGLVVGTPLPGRAQTPVAVEDAREQPPRKSRVEIGATIEALGLMTPLGAGSLPAATVRATIPVRGRFAIDTTVAVPRQEYDSYYGFYGVQVRQRLRRGSNASTELFVTYGGLGVYEHTRSIEYRYRGINGTEQVYRTPSHTMVTAPFLPTAGMGVTQRFAGSLAWRADVDVFGLIYPAFIGYRLSVGVVVPIGGGR